MALDAATLALTARELKAALTEAKIAKIFEPTRDELVLTLRTRTDTYSLLLSARSGSARVGSGGPKAPRRVPDCGSAGQHSQPRPVYLFIIKKTFQSRYRSPAAPLSALACHLPRPGESFRSGEPLAKRVRFR